MSFPKVDCQPLTRFFLSIKIIVSKVNLNHKIGKLPPVWSPLNVSSESLSVVCYSIPESHQFYVQVDIKRY